MLRNLYTLASLMQNDKLMTQDYSFNIYTPTALRGLVRKWYGEGREQNVEHIRQTVHQGISLATTRLREADDLRRAAAAAGRRRAVSGGDVAAGAATSLRARRLLEALHHSKKGMRNLMTTYRDDAALYSQFSLLIQEIEDFGTVVSSCLGGSEDGPALVGASSVAKAGEEEEAEEEGGIFRLNL